VIRRRRRQSGSSSFAGFRFPPDVILLVVRWYLRYRLFYRDVQELLAERGVEVDHVTIYGWVQRFTPRVVEAARPCRHSVGDRWFVDETYVKVAGVWRYVYRAVDQHGQVIDVYVSKRRNVAAATRFFQTMLVGRDRPREVTIDLAAPLHRCYAWSTTSSPRCCMTRPNIRTTGSSAITEGSRRGCGRCAVCERIGPRRR
jgi:IS6 family transposase